MKQIIIAHEDSDLLVINKPSGMVVNRAKSVKGKTVQDWVESKLWSGEKEILRHPQISHDLRNAQDGKADLKSLSALSNENPDWDEVNRRAFYNRNGIVHRLDKETSGVMVIAKNEDTFVEMLRQFREREVQKTYWALVHGQLQITKKLKNLETKKQDNDDILWQVVKASVGRLPWNRERFGVLSEGRAAVTKYRVIKHFESRIKIYNNHKEKLLPKQKFTLVELKPKTGRTHQIRIHMKYLGHPLVADNFYAGRKTSRIDRRWCPRLWLHARNLEFKHPSSNKKVKFEAELGEDLKQVLEMLSR